jgi:hypothetical protein
MKTTKNSNTVANNSNSVNVPTSVTKSIVKGRKAKRKAIKPSKGQLAQRKANNTFKAETFSISGLIRYSKDNAKGRKALEQLIKIETERHSTTFDIKQVTAKLVLANMTEYERTNKADGTPKKLHSFWFMLNAVKRAIKAA